MINTKKFNVVIFGGGDVGFRKAKTFLQYGMNVKVISPNIAPKFKDIMDRIEYIQDIFKPEYIKEKSIVIGATSSREINHGIYQECNRKGILCNIVDDKEESDFIIPSTFKQGPIVVGVSTEGNSPYFAAQLRREIMEICNEDMVERVEEMGKIRKIVIKKCVDNEKRKTIFKELAYLNLQELKDRRIKYENCSRI